MSGPSQQNQGRCMAHVNHYMETMGQSRETVGREASQELERSPRDEFWKGIINYGKDRLKSKRHTGTFPQKLDNTAA